MIPSCARILVGHADEAFRRRHLRRPLEREEVLRLPEPAGLQQFRVVGRVVRHHHVRRRIEPVHEQPALLVGGEAHGPDDLLEPAPPGPVPRRSDERRRDARVVDRLEEPEVADLATVERVVVPVLDGGDPPDDLALPAGQEEGHLGVTEERIVRRVQELVPLHDERGNPERVVLVQLEREPDEAVLLEPRRDQGDFDVLGGLGDLGDVRNDDRSGGHGGVLAWGGRVRRPADCRSNSAGGGT